MINADGYSSPLVTIVSVKEMEPDMWHVEEVAKLAISSLPGSKGYIYFCKSRCGVREMWIDYFKRVVIPTILSVNRDNASLDTADMTTFFSTDGEDIVICSGYDDEVANAFNYHKIDYGRVGAATTGIHNPCDRAALIRDVKKMIISIAKKNIDVGDEALQASVKVSFANLKTKFPDISIGAGFISNIVYGMEVIVYAYQKCMTRVGNQKAFKVCGQHVDPQRSGSGDTVCFRTMMAQCYSDIPQDQLDLMYRLRDTFSETIRLEGRVPYPDIIAAGVYPGPTTENRDNFTHVRSFSYVVSHRESKARYLEEKRLKSPEYLAEQRRLKEAQRLLEREEAARRKEQESANSRAVRDKARADEKERIKLLTQEEKERAKNAAAAEKQRKADAKRRQDEEEMAELAAARKIIEDQEYEKKRYKTRRRASTRCGFNVEGSIQYFGK